MKNSRKLRAHVLRLAYLNSVQVRFVTRLRRVRSNRGKRTIWIKAIRSERTYAQAMHELGHIMRPYMCDVFTSELIAWNWAVVNSIQWTKGMSRFMQFCIQSYINSEQSKQEQQYVRHEWF